MDGFLARDVLQAGLSRHRRRPVRIVELSRLPMHTASTHPISRLAARLDDGEQLSVVFKRLQPHPAKDVRREVLLYERLLAGGRFGAPVLYAACRDDTRLRYWLFLEDVGQRRLDWCTADGWPPAFRWLARMHAASRDHEDEFSRVDGLDEHGPAFYRSLAAAARGRLVEHDLPHAVVRFDEAMARWLAWSVGVLDRQPRTLVHGDLSCHNVMVQRDGRIRPIDWEWAAVGPAAWDVAKLLAGWGKRKARLLGDYLDELDRVGAPLDRGAFTAAVAHARVMHKLWYLKWWIEPCQDPAYVDVLLDMMERTWRDLEREAA